jgi:hypothetical protein
MALCKFVGCILGFDAREYADKAEVRAKLDYDSSLLVVCSIGGTPRVSTLPNKVREVEGNFKR